MITEKFVIQIRVNFIKATSMLHCRSILDVKNKITCSYLKVNVYRGYATIIILVGEHNSSNNIAHHYKSFNVQEQQYCIRDVIVTESNHT